MKNKPICIYTAECEEYSNKEQLSMLLDVIDVNEHVFAYSDDAYFYEPYEEKAGLQKVIEEIKEGKFERVYVLSPEIFFGEFSDAKKIYDELKTHRNNVYVLSREQVIRIHSISDVKEKAENLFFSVLRVQYHLYAAHTIKEDVFEFVEEDAEKFFSTN